MNITEEIIKERSIFEITWRKDREEALKHCRNQYERDQCREAYAKLHYANEDVMRQRYGLPALTYKRT